MKKLFPSGYDEIRGIADGSGLPLEDIVMLNARYDLARIMYRMQNGGQTVQEGGGWGWWKLNRKRRMAIVRKMKLTSPMNAPASNSHPKLWRINTALQHGIGIWINICISMIYAFVSRCNWIPLKTAQLYSASPRLAN